MLLFRRIFDFQKDEVPAVEQRMSRRYVPGAQFGLRATLRAGGRDRVVRLRDLSAGGLAVVVPDEAAPPAGSEVELGLALEDHRLDLRATAAHGGSADQGRVVGLSLQFADFPQRKAYLQLLQPVAIGGSLQPVDPARVSQGEPQFIKQVYRGDDDAALSVWLAKSFGTPLHSFEFRMRDYFVRAEAAVGVLEVYRREQLEATHKGKFTRPVFDASGDATDEIRRFFRWVVANLPATLPEDVRDFLRKVAG